MLPVGGVGSAHGGRATLPSPWVPVPPHTWARPPQTLPVPEGAVARGLQVEAGAEWEQGLSPGPLGGTQHCVPTSAREGSPPPHPLHVSLGAFEAGTAHHSDHLPMWTWPQQ